MLPEKTVLASPADYRDLAWRKWIDSVRVLIQISHACS